MHNIIGHSTSPLLNPIPSEYPPSPCLSPWFFQFGCCVSTAKNSPTLWRQNNNRNFILESECKLNGFRPPTTHNTIHNRILPRGTCLVSGVGSLMRLFAMRGCGRLGGGGVYVVILSIMSMDSSGRERSQSVALINRTVPEEVQWTMSLALCVVIATSPGTSAWDSHFNFDN